MYGVLLLFSCLSDETFEQLSRRVSDESYSCCLYAFGGDKGATRAGSC